MIKDATMKERKRIYQAVIWELDSDKPGMHTTVLADDLEEAERKLRQQYGEGVVVSLHNQEDADEPR